jgi:3-hydroxyisobutyrate dehydrogenase-like beta-hydroxyacid dehydrogenase
MSKDSLGFIGLGVMGEPMCRNLATKMSRPVIAYDIDAAPLDRLAAHGVKSAHSAGDVAALAEVVMLSLPGGKQLQQLCEGAGGLLEVMKSGQTLIDLGTSPVKLTKELAGKFAAKGVKYADAPVARTRKAAEEGTLAITVGGTKDVFNAIEPLLRCFASEVTHCGDVGAGQVVKILNNMMVVCTVVALSEARALAEGAGVDTKILFDALSKGSADSFALRNHGMKSVLVQEFPERAFPVDYMLKDMDYVQALAADANFKAVALTYGHELLSNASQLGHHTPYWPIISKLVDGTLKPTE